MNGGYPEIADIDVLMEDQGVRIPDLSNPNYYDQFKQFVFSLINRSLFAGTLSLYLPNATTFNLVGGSYNFKGEVKTFVPGDAIDPTNNDTTYVWLNPDGTIGSVIDGTGWPTTEHIKLAEVDADNEGVITEIRDLRGQTFLKYSPGVVLLSSVTVNLNAAADTETVLFTVPTGKKLIVDKVVIRGLSATAAASVITLGKGGGACNEFLGDQTLSNLDGVTKAAVLQAIPNATPVAQTILAAAETFSCEITTAAGSTCTATFDVFGYLINA
jgi:hypothetical protein